MISKFNIPCANIMPVILSKWLSFFAAVDLHSLAVLWAIHMRNVKKLCQQAKVSEMAIHHHSPSANTHIAQTYTFLPNGVFAHFGSIADDKMAATLETMWHQWRIQDFPEGGREPSRGGVNTPNFPENCMKSKEFGRPGGGVRPSRPPRSANGHMQVKGARGGEEMTEVHQCLWPSDHSSPLLSEKSVPSWPPTNFYSSNRHCVNIS